MKITKYISLLAILAFIGCYNTSPYSGNKRPIRYGGVVNPGGGGGGGGTVTSVTGTPPVTSSGGNTPAIGITLPLTGNAVTLAGDVAGASNANTLQLTSNIQQPAFFRGTAAVQPFSATTTTSAITSPPNVVNGDIEVVVIGINNTTSNTFVPPSGWAAIANCNASGNTVQVQAFSHTASSEGGTIAAFTWTTNGTGFVYATDMGNVGVPTCAANTAAAGTTASTAGITATATSDREAVVGGQPGTAARITATTQTLAGLTWDQSVGNAGNGSGSGSVAELSYPITNTAVAAFSFTSTASAAWVTLQLSFPFAASSTAGPPGALTYNETGGTYLGSLVLAGKKLTIAGQNYALLLPNDSGTMKGGIGGVDSDGALRTVFNLSGATITIGDSNANNTGGSTISLQGPTTVVGTLATTNHNFSTTTGTITSTTGNHQCTTCQIGTTGGGIISTTGGTAPTVTCSGGSTGTSVTAGSTNNRGQIVSSSSASTNCTITWSAAATWPQAPFCVFEDGGASITPTTYSTGACGTSTCVVDFASATSKTINYICM